MPYDIKPNNKYELRINGESFHRFSDNEITQVIYYGELQKGRNGNLRTKQLLTLALDYLRSDLVSFEGMEHKLIGYYNTMYDLDFHDGCITLDRQRIQFPKLQEVQHVLDHLDTVVRKFPPINEQKIQRAWDIHLEGIVINTVFFTPQITREDVYKTLVMQDRYDPRIKLSWRE